MTHDSRYAPRARQAEKILAVLRDFLGPDLTRFSCLDVGCSDGGISLNLAGQFRRVVGIDLDREAVGRASLQARRERQAGAVEFSLAGGHKIPFPDCSFDVAVCAQVYEHTTEQAALAQDIFRVLRPGGVLFFSGPNRLKFMEEHYWLPFLSWPPRPISHAYMRIFRRGTYYDAYPRFYWQIRRLWRDFQFNDYTLPMILEPQRFALGARLGKLAWVRNLPPGLLRLLAPLYPNYNWILVKPQ